MAGNADNTALWQGADVFIAPVDTAGPDDVSTAWGADWKVAGLLDGASGFTETRDQDTSEHYAWGGVLFRRTSSKHKRSIKFVALEDNDVTFGLVNPGSTRSTTSGVRKGKIKIPTRKSFAIGFEVRDGDKIKRRIVKHAEVSEIADITESESDPTVYEITVLIFPEADNTLYTTVESDPATA
ncbi:phage tail tube protein [Arthrobacter sp. B2a2-09]|uniref:phage tail tube protein n=1 Tax=Arthrobacter sp. B2a2-09 TaxID=2952822 RepID=UPI0022CD56FA|nr:hypothetical protein [Arthrobacter sp. B2a2-09]MCZ9884641.1 hypothetical protein [Arthrobacter sp. B2a2-09]